MTYDQRRSVPGQSLFDCAEQLGHPCADLLPARRAAARSASSRSRDGHGAALPAPTDARAPPHRARTACRASAASPPATGHVRVPHDAPRADAHRAAARPPLAAQPRCVGTPDPAVTRDGDRVLLDGDDDRSVPRRAPRRRHGPGHDDRRPPAPRPRNRRDAGGHVVREPAALRRVRRHGAHPVRHRARPARPRAHAGRLHQPRDRGVPRRSGDDLRDDGRRATRRCATCSSGRTCRPIGQSPYRSITEIDVLEGRRATTSLADTGRRCLPADPPEGARLRAARHQRPRRRRRGRVPAGDRSRPRGSPRGDHGHRHQHRADRRQPAPHRSRRRARPGPRSRAAASPAACPRSTARSSRSSRRRRRHVPPRGHRRHRRRRASAAPGSSTC